MLTGKPYYTLYLLSFLRLLGFHSVELGLLLQSGLVVCREELDGLLVAHHRVDTGVARSIGFQSGDGGTIDLVDLQNDLIRAALEIIRVREDL